MTATHCHIIQHTATYYNTLALQHTATHYNRRVCILSLQLRLFCSSPGILSKMDLFSTVTHFRILQHAATYFNTRPHTATHYHILQRPTTYCNTHQNTAKHCHILQHSATRCRPLPRIATYYYTLQHTDTNYDKDLCTLSVLFDTFFTAANDSFLGTKGLPRLYLHPYSFFSQQFCPRDLPRDHYQY